jgi:hypothetical protein
VHKRVTYYTTVAAGLATCDAIAHMNDVDVNRLQDLHQAIVSDTISLPALDTAPMPVLAEPAVSEGGA